MSTFAGMAFAKGLPPLAQRVAADKRAVLSTAMQRCGLQGPYIDQMKTWAAAFMLLTGMLLGNLMSSGGRTRSGAAETRGPRLGRVAQGRGPAARRRAVRHLVRAPGRQAGDGTAEDNL